MKIGSVLSILIIIVAFLGFLFISVGFFEVLDLIVIIVLAIVGLVIDSARKGYQKASQPP